ncbi:hypothetical protein QCA50_020338 [Cerrena zonata]|uniref:Uncharacterized protein n=1 Tax=Cerrena zonata TaxID=2478898 RepID=A0AAW0F9B8_9APHY
MLTTTVLPVSCTHLLTLRFLPSVQYLLSLPRITHYNISAPAPASSMLECITSAGWKLWNRCTCSDHYPLNVVTSILVVYPPCPCPNSTWPSSRIPLASSYLVSINSNTGTTVDVLRAGCQICVRLFYEESMGYVTSFGYQGEVAQSERPLQPCHTHDGHLTLIRVETRSSWPYACSASMPNTVLTTPNHHIE